MPTYEYACAVCGIIEVFQSMREDPLSACPECSSKKIQRLISGGAGIIFKGDGFWETDYNRSSDYKEQSTSEGKKTAPKTDTSSTTKEQSAEPKPKSKKQPKKDK